MANLNALSLAELTAHFNALPGVTPVKKFPSKAVALSRIAKVTPTAASKPVRQHLVLEAVEGQSLASRRRPLGDTAARVQELVTKFGGKTVTMAEAATALGVEVQEVKRRVKRLQSWYGTDVVVRHAGSITINFVAK